MNDVAHFALLMSCRLMDAATRPHLISGVQTMEQDRLSPSTQAKTCRSVCSTTNRAIQVTQVATCLLFPALIIGTH
jgi:hypothetical protein